MAAEVEDAAIASYVEREAAEQSTRHGFDYDPINDPDITDYKTLYLREKSFSQQLERELDDAEAHVSRCIAWGRDMRDRWCMLDEAMCYVHCWRDVELMREGGVWRSPNAVAEHCTEEDQHERWACVEALCSAAD